MAAANESTSVADMEGDMRVLLDQLQEARLAEEGLRTELKECRTQARATLSHAALPMCLAPAWSCVCAPSCAPPS
jgi:hypothetical protein